LIEGAGSFEGGLLGINPNKFRIPPPTNDFLLRLFLLVFLLLYFLERFFLNVAIYKYKIFKKNFSFKYFIKQLKK
jgi:hypothetical protein